MAAYFEGKYWSSPMRRLCFLLLLTALAIPASALGARGAPGDGSFVISRANGAIVVQGKGLIYGHFDRGTLTVIDYTPDDILVPSVSGAKKPRLVPGSLDVVYAGGDVRFLFPSGKYTLRIEGFGIDISAVGKGIAQVAGSGSFDDGTFSVNGGKGVDIGLRPMWTGFGPGEKVGGGGKGL